MLSNRGFDLQGCIDSIEVVRKDENLFQSTGVVSLDNASKISCLQSNFIGTILLDAFQNKN